MAVPWTLLATLACLLTASIAPADEALLAEAAAWPHGPALALHTAHLTEARFVLPADHAKPVYLYLQAILRYRALSHSAGVLRFAVNGEELGPEQSVNKAGEYCPRPNGPYAARAFALPAPASTPESARTSAGWATSSTSPTSRGRARMSCASPTWPPARRPCCATSRWWSPASARRWNSAPLALRPPSR